MRRGIEETLAFEATAEAWMAGLRWIEEGRAAEMTSPQRRGTLCIAAYNIALDICRRRRRSLLGKAESLNSVRNEPVSKLEPFHTAAAVEEQVLIRECFASLGDDDRCLLELRIFDKATFFEIGELLGCSASTAYRRIAAACHRLKDLFLRRRLNCPGRFSCGAHFIDEADE
jgi:DNA-directed RNA polymerase specialized sigma24 family protein